MRKSVLAIAAAGSIFAGTAAAASVSISPADSQTLNQASVGTQSVSWNTCAAATFDIVYTQNTTVGDPDYLKITDVEITVNDATSADLDNCDLVNFSLDGGSTWDSANVMAATTGSGPYARSSGTLPITASDTITSVKVEFLAS